MLKPWVVYTMLWLYKGGILFTLATAVSVGYSRTAFPLATRSNERGLNLLILGVYVVAGLAGWVVGFITLTFVLAGVFLLVYGLCRLTTFAWIPLAIIAWFGFPVGAIFTNDNQNEHVPKWEMRLAPGLACRAYPKHFDSIPGTRLVLARANASWFRDDVFEGLATHYPALSCRCSLLPDGRVTMVMRSSDSEEAVIMKLD
ncbi:MAG: hypothetical protein HZB13_19850 [Acidobacteria bacterium]|nr:hypothetical protein [Acidobacteriota bacterium]